MRRTNCMISENIKRRFSASYTKQNTGKFYIHNPILDYEPCFEVFSEHDD
jgi:hypothetical protein